MEGLIPGRIVHYVAPGSADGTYPPAHRAATVTEVVPDGPNEAGIHRLNLMVCNPAGVHFPQGVPLEATGTQPFTWHWIEWTGETDAR